MPVTIRNLAPRTVSVALNTLGTLWLAPGQSSGELNEIEIKQNAKVDKLQSQRVIAIESTGSQPAPSSSPPGQEPMAAVPGAAVAEGGADAPADDTDGEGAPAGGSRSKKRSGSAG